MNAGAIAGVITAAAGLVAAVTALVAQWRHVNGPAHKQRTSSGGAGGTTRAG